MRAMKGEGGELAAGDLEHDEVGGHHQRSLWRNERTRHTTERKETIASVGAIFSSRAKVG